MESGPQGDSMRIDSPNRLLVLPLSKLMPFFGLWTMVDWIYWFNKTPLREGFPDTWWWGVYPAMTLFMLGAFLIWRTRAVTARSAIRLDGAMALLTVACVASILVNGVTCKNIAWDFANSTVAGLCMSWGYLRWAKVYFTLTLRDVAACLCIAYFFGSGLKIVLDILNGPIGAVIAAAIPIVCAVSLRLVDSREYPPVTDRGELLYRPRAFKPLLSTFAWLFVFFIATRYCIGSQSWAGTNGGIVGHLLEMTLAGFAFLWVFKFDRPIDFPMLWRFTFLFFSTAIVLGQLPYAWCDPALRCLNQVGVSLSVMLLWFLLVDISHHCSWHPCAAFGLGWASYVGSRWVVDLLNHYVPSSLFGETAALIGLWTSASCVIFMLSASNPQMKKFFADLQPPVVEVVRFTTLDERCRLYAETYGLTNREIDVLQLYARGHSKASIADSLHLSENTVRNHVKRIYGKVGVHTRDELLAMLNE